MVDVITEGRHRGEFEVEKFSDNFNNDVVTFASGQKHGPGTVSAKAATGDKFSQLDPGATDAGLKKAVAILHEHVDASAADAEAVVVARGPYVANGKELTWPAGITDVQKKAAIDNLLTLGIRVL